MATYSYDEAIYGALCYIFTCYQYDDLNKTEKEVIQETFNKRHSLSSESMKDVYFMCSYNSCNPIDDVTDSLMEYSLSQRLKAYETICIVVNKYIYEFSCASDEIWQLAHYIMQKLEISQEDYARYIKA